MKKIFRKNQIIITALALMIAVAGYINYADNVKEKKLTEASQKTAIESETDEVSGDILSNDAEPDDESISDPGTTVFTSGVTSQFIVSAKLEREQIRADNKQTLLEVINNVEITDEVKAEAVAKMTALTDASEKEVAAELLLEAKGFENVIVSIANEQVDVVIETKEITATQLAQIEDVVTRKTGCGIADLTITSVYPAEEVNAETNTEGETESETEGETIEEGTTKATPEMESLSDGTIY